MSIDGIRVGAASRQRRCTALLAAGVLLPLPVLAGCSSSSSEEATPRQAVVPQDVASAARGQLRGGGTVRWAIDAVPVTLNTFQSDADAASDRIAGAVLPALFTLDERGRPKRNPDYLDSADVTEREPQQVVVYKLKRAAKWSDGRALGAEDFAAQWKALSGRNRAYWTARNAGYERIRKIEQGHSPQEVRVTFGKPYTDWRSLFTPLYPKAVMGTPGAFNDGARKTLKATAGPFALKDVDGTKGRGKVTLVRNTRWWGERPKLDSVVFKAVARDRRAAALSDGELDVADIDRSTVEKIQAAARPKSGGRSEKGGDARQAAHHGESLAGALRSAHAGPTEALRAWARAHGTPQERAAERARRAAASRAENLRGYTVRKSLEPAYTQLALNGASGPLADERVRRAVARAINRQAIADAVLKPLALPAQPLGSHLLMAGQQGYQDNSAALGSQDTEAAQALLSSAGWRREGGADLPKAGGKAEDRRNGDDTGQDGDEKKKQAREERGEKKDEKKKDEKKNEKQRDEEKQAREKRDEEKPAKKDGEKQESARKDDGEKRDGEKQDGEKKDREKKGSAKEAGPGGSRAGSADVHAVRKDGKPLVLRFVLPTGTGAEPLRTVGDRISAMLEDIGVRTEIVKVKDDSYFKDHIAAGDYDLALWSWPASAYPATDARPIFAKPQPAADGSLIVEQNYTRVGTDHIDQLFDQAVSELDGAASRSLVRRADARIWAVAGSLPLYQRPQLVAARSNLANVGAYGFATPRYQDIGFRK
ncbi:ABC transporter substrate-binding protein [Streptomyces sp. bgisy100]|uniref:ABC transporter family substrate-binding protein n=1 Tax=Streptomyces sp. bgisy100 TaxID=3413783 RepID=UPI003D722D99